MSPQSAPQSTASREPGKRSPCVSADALQAWYQQYVAQDGGSISRGSPVIQAVESDMLDYVQIEAQVQQLTPTAGVVDGFCTKCQHLLDHWPNTRFLDGSEGAICRHFHTNEVEAAARLGCRFCAFLLSRLEHVSLLGTFRKIEARLRRAGDDGTASLSTGEPERWANGGQMLWLNFPGKIACRLSDWGATTFFFSHILPPSTNLWRHSVDDSFETARMWLARCTESHELCRGKRQYRPPSRLISIGQGAVKLVVTASLPAPPRYATLSYCWGSEPFTTLTRENMNLFLDHIPLDGLPQTFIDAIDTARRLGIGYIWIDALCIIQKEENNSDWAKEAGHMSAVYSGTLVNLAASTATSVHEGFLHKLRPRHRNLGFVAKVTEGDHCTVQSFHGLTAHEDSTTRTYLATRAWTLQERLLSPRSLYLGKTGLFWVCRTHLGSELTPDEVPSVYGYGRLSAVAEDMPFHWGEIISQYSGAKLTYSSDRLPALSGLAARQQQVTGDQYLAGMWRRSLITQLPWNVVLNKSRRPKWRAPTWSWTSIDGQVTRIESQAEDWNACIEVLDVFTTPSGPDPYGAVADGELTISCAHLVRVHINIDEDVGVLADDLLQAQLGPRSFRVKTDCLEEISSQNHGVLHMLPIVEREMEGSPRISGQSPARLVMHGLILRASGDSVEPKHFRRIGSFNFNKEKDCAREKEIYQAFMHVLSQEGHSVVVTDLAQTVAASDSPDGRLVIIIK